MKNPKPYSYVVLVGIDGMGAFHKQANTPCLDAIFENGATTYKSVSMDPTISAQNWGAILLGTDPVVHRMTNNSIGQHENTNPDLPSVFKLLRREFPDAFLASYSGWGAINKGIIEHDLGVEMVGGMEDAPLAEKILECIPRKPKYLFIQFDSVDSAGHGYGYGTPDYLRVIEKMDGVVGQIFDAYKKAGILDETLFLVTADHGGIRVGHGDFSESEKYVFLGAAGKYVKKGQIGPARTKDMAAIVLYALGAEVPAYNEKGFSAQVPSGIFPELPDTYRQVKIDPIRSAGLPTPPIDGEKGLYSFIDKDRVALAWFCDDKLEDATGKNRLTPHGLIKYYSRGIRSDLAECGKTGFATTEDLRFGKRFSIALWLQSEPLMTEAIAVCGTSDFFWRNRSVRGFSVSLRAGDAMLTVGNDNDHEDVMVAFPEEAGDGWVHTVFSVDMENGIVKVYYNFKLADTYRLEEQYRGIDMNNLPFTIGNDGANTHNNELYALTYRMDDFFVFNDTLTDDEIDALRRYYGK